MPSPDDLYPPAQYDGGWLLLVIGLVLVAIAASVVVWWFTRPLQPKQDPETPPVPAGELVHALRLEYVEAIDTVERDAAAGRVDARTANRALSALARRFVNEYSGYEAPVLALEDLEAAGVRRELVDAMRQHWYPAIFRREHGGDVRASAHAARQVIATWR